MLIPIKLEGDTPESCETVPIVTFPPESPEERVSARDNSFGSILMPALSKYLRLRDSNRKDFSSLLVKEHPIQLESFKIDDKYELQLDMRKYKPEEITVKISPDSISVMAHQEEKLGNFSCKRQKFLRRYSLPPQVNAEDIKCEIGSDGHLRISAPKQQHTVEISEVTLPLTHSDAIKKI